MIKILELDEETVSTGRAKLAGFDFDDIYGDEDRATPELMITAQAERIRELFTTIEELNLAFSTNEKIKEAKKDMTIDKIDIDYIKHYCFKRQIDFKNDLDALLAIAFDLETKK